MLSLIQDLRYALRVLHCNPGFAAVAVWVLALGIGANTAVFTVVNGVLLRPLPFPDPARLMLISNAPGRGPFGPGLGLIEPDYLEFQQRNRLFDRVATFNGRGITITGGGEPARLPAAGVTTGFFATLGVNAVLGRTFLGEDEQPGRDHVAVLSDALWRNRMGADPHVLGRTVKVDGVAHTVIGVMPAGFNFPNDAELWTPLSIRVNPHNVSLRPVVGRLKPGASAGQAQAELEAITLGLHSGRERLDLVARVLPLKELLVQKVRESLWIFTGAVAFVLLIACANVANLLLIRAVSRQREMAVRTALGAGRWRLVRQLLVEGTLLATAGGAAGLLLAMWGVPLLLALAPHDKIPRRAEVHIDGWVLAFTLCVSVLTGLLFGLAPATQVLRRKPRRLLSHTARTMSRPRSGLRSALVVSEMALALVLLSGAGLMLKSFLRMRTVDPGFRAANALTMTVSLPDAVYHTPPAMREFHRRMLERLTAMPGAAAAGAVNWRPLGRALIRGDFKIEGGRERPRGYVVDKPVVSPGYFRAMGIRVLNGREFSEHDAADAPGVVVVSRSVAREIWPGEDPLGKRISMEDNPSPKDWLTVVGVVDDVRQQALTERPGRAIYRSYEQVSVPFFLAEMNFVVRTSADPASAAPAMRRALREVDPDLPAELIATIEDLVARTTAEPLFHTRLLAAFAILALLLAAVGIYGVLAYSVAERTHEIGIRMALGADGGNVLRSVLWRTLLLAATGVALGIAGALAVTRVLARLLFEVKPADGPTLAAVAAMLAAVALLAGWLPARRAARVDPVVALRYE